MWPGSSPSAVVNGAAGMIIAALVVAALYVGRDLFMPLALAGLLGFVLAPLVRRLTNWRLPNGLSVALVIVLLLGSLSAGGMVVGRQLTQLLEDLPTHEANLRDKARFVHFEFGGTGIWQRAVATVRGIEEEVRDPQADKPLKIEVAQRADDPLMTIFEYTRVSAPSLMSAVLVLLLTIFMLLQYRDLRDRMVRLMGTAEMGRSTQALDEASANLGHYLTAVGRERDLWGIRRPLAMGHWNSQPDLVGGPDGRLAVRPLYRRYSCGCLPDGACRDDRSGMVEAGGDRSGLHRR
jgi:predicted PurR-regulated permease PerM